MMKKLLIILPIIVFATILMAGIVSAASTWETMTSSTQLNKTQLFNISSTLATIVNCSISCTSSVSGGSFTVTTLNTTTGSENFTNAVESTLNDEDAPDWTCSGTCYNLSGSSESLAAITSLTIDNTLPTCSISTLTSGGKYAPSSIFTVTGYNSSSTGTRIAFGGNWYDMEMTTRDTTTMLTTYTYSKGVPERTFTVKAFTTDGTNVTDCTSISDVQIEEGARRLLNLAIVQAGSGQATTPVAVQSVFGGIISGVADKVTNGKLFGIPILYIIIIGVAVYYFKFAKQKK